MTSGFEAFSQASAFFVLLVGVVAVQPWAPDPIWVPLPMAVWLGGTVGGGFLHSLVRRWGGSKRAQLVTVTVGVVGAVVTIGGLTTGHFALVVLGFGLLGIHQGDLRLPVHWAGAGGAVAGPWLGVAGQNLTTSPFVGAFGLLLVFLGVRALVAARASQENLGGDSVAAGESWPWWLLPTLAMAPAFLHELGEPLWVAALGANAFALGALAGTAPRFWQRVRPWIRWLTGLALLSGAGTVAFFDADAWETLLALGLFGLGWGPGSSTRVFAGGRRKRLLGLGTLLAAVGLFGLAWWERSLGWGPLQLLVPLGAFVSGLPWLGKSIKSDC